MITSERYRWALDLFTMLDLPGRAEDMPEWDLYTRLEELDYTYVPGRGWLPADWLADLSDDDLPPADDGL